MLQFAAAALRAVPMLARGGAALGRGARLIGAGAKGETLRKAVADQAINNAMNARRVAFRDATAGATNAAQRMAMGRQAVRANPVPTMTDALNNTSVKNINAVDRYAHGAGRVLNAASMPFGGPAGLAMTGVFMAPALLPQNSYEPEPQMGYQPFNNAYTQMPTPQGMTIAPPARMSEMPPEAIAAMQQNAMGQLQPLTDEQIVKAQRRNAEQAQLNAIYAQTLAEMQGMQSSSGGY